MKTMKNRIENTFHATAATFTGTPDADGFVRVSNRTYRRICNDLCGIKECSCSGHQPYMQPLGGASRTCDYLVKVRRGEVVGEGS